VWVLPLGGANNADERNGEEAERRRRSPAWPAARLEHTGHVEEEAEREDSEDGVTEGGDEQRRLPRSSFT
jgi:hypothetical protein